MSKQDNYIHFAAINATYTRCGKKVVDVTSCTRWESADCPRCKHT